MNYCEMTDHNERVLSGEYSVDEEQAIIGEIEKSENFKRRRLEEARKVRDQVDK